jgi:NAD(P)H dehydrogenase (quinone)
MSRVLILYHLACGQTETMAVAVAEGAREAGADVELKRVPGPVPDEAGRRPGWLGAPAPVARVDELPDYDAIVVGIETRDGRMAPQMASFLDRAGARWAAGALNGKVGSAFASAATCHRGQETGLMAIYATLLHLGMVAVGSPCGSSARSLDGTGGGSPYGAVPIAGRDGPRHPSADELDSARQQGRHVAGVAGRLFPRFSLEAGETEQTEHFMLSR